VLLLLLIRSDEVLALFTKTVIILAFKKGWKTSRYSIVIYYGNPEENVKHQYRQRAISRTE